MCHVPCVFVFLLVSTAAMETEMDSAIRYERLVIPDSARGRIGADASCLDAAMQPQFITYTVPAMSPRWKG